MKIYTSYYARVKDLPKGLVPISISRTKPHWAKVNWEFPELAPTIEHDEARASMYLMAYWKQLALLSASHTEECIMGTLMVESQRGLNAKAAVLLCYEKPEDFCHRHLVAQWFRAHGYDCTELAFDQRHAARYPDDVPTTLITRK